MAPQLADDLARGGLLTGYVDTSDAAKILHVSASFLNKARSSGTGPEYVKFGAAVRYAVEALHAYAAARRRSSTSESAHP
jgi:hypothetical protein